jgi:hypothetical protein
MFVNSDFSDLLQLFNDNKVRYLVIGGYAATIYQRPGFVDQQRYPERLSSLQLPQGFRSAVGRYD